MKLLLLIGLGVLVSACNSNTPSFATMGAAELAAYNRDQPAEKQVFCRESTSTATLIRRRVCQSFEDWVEANERAAMTIDVLDTEPNYNAPTSILQGGPRG